LEARVDKELSRQQLAERLQEAQQFEQFLAKEGIAVVKLWFALSEEQLQLRLAELRKNPVLRWQAKQNLAWHKPKVFQRYSAAAQQLWQSQDTEQTRWHLIDGWDEEERDSCAAKILLAAMQECLAEAPTAKMSELPALKLPKFLHTLDLSPQLKKDDYEQELVLAQAEFATLFRLKKMDDRALAIVFEGMDAAGKGGAIRRLTAALDPREYHVMQVSAPTAQERLLPYLQRFWQKIPARGQCTIFDRSWYGRVLVERVDGFCTPEEWARAYGEINAFEAELTAARVVVVKFWLAIDQDVQLARFKERESIPFKHFKITADDWHNREKWDDYIEAGSEAIERTHHRKRPWVVIPANNKYYARVQVMKALNDVLRAL
jgi:polyphosphate kinase 2 (PPK2 family)